MGKERNSDNKSGFSRARKRGLTRCTSSSNKGVSLNKTINSSAVSRRPLHTNIHSVLSDAQSRYVPNAALDALFNFSASKSHNRCFHLPGRHTPTKRKKTQARGLKPLPLITTIPATFKQERKKNTGLSHLASTPVNISCELPAEEKPDPNSVAHCTNSSKASSSSSKFCRSTALPLMGDQPLCEHIKYLPSLCQAPKHEQDDACMTEGTMLLFSQQKMRWTNTGKESEFQTL